MLRDRRKSRIIAEREDSAFVIVDFQEKLIPHIPNADSIRKNLSRIARAAGILRVPLLVTEQYPRGLGKTDPEIERAVGNVQCIEKISFSCFGEPKFLGRLKGMNVQTLLLGGIETHICIAQTALHALLAGYQVHVLVDAVGSREPAATKTAVNRIKEAGGIVSTTEMALYELMGKAGSPEFKEIQALLAE
ncbi:MAG: isochorismatase family protein [Candidatus Omnitrophica bacterium]|nr:isochorismatase family protein [Candidatus Omnitrophota bacterium]MCA9434906.1 isochorismatase family protein [Candidatus Omnitrophota bacterium]